MKSEYKIRKQPEKQGGRTARMQTGLLSRQIEDRVIEIANYIVEHQATVRQTAKQFGVSKSTVHKDITERLEAMNHVLAEEVRKVLDINKSERHLRGGLATREKYLQRMQH